MAEKLSMYLEFPFVQNALIVGVLIALCSSLLGVVLVLRRFSFIGDGLSHVAFGAMSAAAVMNITDDMPLILAVTIICAVILLKSGNNTAVKGDAAVAMLSVSSLAVGYLLMNVFSSSSNLSGDVCTTLFGSTSILTLSENDVKLCVILSVITVIMFVYFYNRIFAVTFDEEFASACGTNAKLCNLITAVTTAAVIVLSMKLAGALLISALVVFPALSAMRVFRSFMAVTVCSAVISVICAISGMLVSILAGTPVGSTVAAADMIMFAGFFIAGKILGRR